MKFMGSRILNNELGYRAKETSKQNTEWLLVSSHWLL